MDIGGVMLAARRWLQETARVPGAIVDHVIGGGCTLLGGVVLHYLLWLLGNPVLFDVLPWTYVTDGGDLAVFFTVVYSTVRTILGR